MLTQSILSNPMLPPFLPQAPASTSPVAAPDDPEGTFERVLGAATNSGDQRSASAGSNPGPVNSAPSNPQIKQAKKDASVKMTASAANDAAAASSLLVGAMLTFVPQIVNQAVRPAASVMPISATMSGGDELSVSGAALANEPSARAGGPSTSPSEPFTGIPAEVKTLPSDADESAVVVQTLPLLGNGETAMPAVTDAVSDIAAKTSRAASSLSEQTNSSVGKTLQGPAVSSKKFFVDIPSGVGTAQVQEQVQVNPGASDLPASTIVHSDGEKHGQAQSSFADLTMPTMRSAVISVSQNTVQLTAGPTHSVRGITKTTTATDSSSSSSGSSSGQANNQEASTNEGVSGDKSASTFADGVPANASNHGSSKSEGPEAIVDAKSTAAQEIANAPSIAATLPSPPAERNGTAAALARSQPQLPTNSNVLPPQLLESEAVSKGIISSAQLADASGHGEMRIAMDTEKLGMVELRAHMVGDTVGAAITVEKRDVHNALSLELPTLQQALNDKQFRVEQITLTHNSLGSTISDGNASARQDNRTTSGPPQRSWVGDSHEFSPEFLCTENSGIFDSLGRLSVHA